MCGSHRPNILEQPSSLGEICIQYTDMCITRIITIQPPMFLKQEEEIAVWSVQNCAAVGGSGKAHGERYYEWLNRTRGMLTHIGHPFQNTKWGRGFGYRQKTFSYACNCVTSLHEDPPGVPCLTGKTPYHQPSATPRYTTTAPLHHWGSYGSHHAATAGSPTPGPQPPVLGVLGGLRTIEVNQRDSEDVPCGPPTQGFSTAGGYCQVEQVSARQGGTEQQHQCTQVESPTAQ